MSIDRVSWRDVKPSEIKSVFLTDASSDALKSYLFVSKLESGGPGSYEVGAPQSLTRLLKLVNGEWSRKHVPLTIKEFKKGDHTWTAQEAVDQGALAPLNLTMNRLQTVLSWKSGSRGSSRLAILRKIDGSVHPDFNHWLGKLQFGVLLSHPEIILDRAQHAKYWKGWAGGTVMMTPKGQLSWDPLEVCVVLENGDKLLVEV